jgi:hypothetical protein
MCKFVICQSAFQDVGRKYNFAIEQDISLQVNVSAWSIVQTECGWSMIFIGKDKELGEEGKHKKEKRVTVLETGQK